MSCGVTDNAPDHDAIRLVGWVELLAKPIALLLGSRDRSPKNLTMVTRWVSLPLHPSYGLMLRDFTSALSVAETIFAIDRLRIEIGKQSALGLGQMQVDGSGLTAGG